MNRRRISPKRTNQRRTSPKRTSQSKKNDDDHMSEGGPVREHDLIVPTVATQPTILLTTAHIAEEELNSAPYCEPLTATYLRRHKVALRERAAENAIKLQSARKLGYKHF